MALVTPMASPWFHATTAPVLVAAFVLALIALAVQLRPPDDARVAHWASAACWTLAGGLLLGLVLSRQWMLMTVVPIGGVALVGYALWLWRGGRGNDDLEPSIAPVTGVPPPSPMRYGVVTRETGRTNIPRAQFGSGIDVPIDGAGVTDAPDSKFGVEEFEEGKPTDEKGEPPDTDSPPEMRK